LLRGQAGFMAARNKTLKALLLKIQLPAELKSANRAGFAIKNCQPACRATRSIILAWLKNNETARKNLF